MENKKKLTSVNIIEDLYRDFKLLAIDDTINLQKLVNRSIYLYNSDELFREKINELKLNNDNKF